MRRIAIINQKGGVGKTTTAVNLGAALARAGKRVCLLDLDPQAHATTHLGIEPDGKSPSMYDVLIESRPWPRCAGRLTTTYGWRRRTLTWPLPRSSSRASSAVK